MSSHIEMVNGFPIIVDENGNSFSTTNAFTDETLQYYVGTPLEGLDAYGRMIKRFELDKKDSGMKIFIEEYNAITEEEKVQEVSICELKNILNSPESSNVVIELDDIDEHNNLHFAKRVYGIYE